MYAQFEEKTYEQYLTSELVHSKNMFFPPGQVLENIVGFDVALRTSHSHFWRLFPHLHPWWLGGLPLTPGGIELRREWWRALEQEIEYFPKFKFNCFIQAKRPSRMVRSDAAEYSFWNCSYFRYDIFSSQHEALAFLAHRTKGKAAVVYASPAFHTYEELWASANAARMVRDSNFCEAERLNGHSRYSYVISGNSGYGHSDPTPIESSPIEAVLSQLEDQPSTESNRVFLEDTGLALDNAAEHLGALQSTYASMVGTLFKGVESKLAKALSRIYAFQFICNTRLLIGHEG